MSPSSPDSCAPLQPIDALNRECFCLSLDHDALARALDSEIGEPGLAAMVHQRCPYLFAAQPVFIAAAQIQRMADVIHAVEWIVGLPAYQEQVLAAAPPIARLGAEGPSGVFFGFDFHLDQGHLGLIEVNTNAGGAMLNAVLARAQRACCGATGAMRPTLESVAVFEQRIVDMFHQEWRRAGRTRPLASIAIVDAAPEQQYLYPEFVLFKQLFQRHGLRATIAEPAALHWRDGVLRHEDLAIDLVYNRLTDFYLEHPASSTLREACVQDGVVLTPHPRAHALYADKRRLALFSDAAQLQALGVAPAMQQLLVEHVPRTEVVNAADAQRLWDERRGLFFKPVAGFGSRAAYRGDKLTRRVWQDILAGDYVAQALVAPGERTLGPRNEAKVVKFDLRAYAYRGEPQWIAARLYQGQTTNFRTPGGGFAPVYSTVEASGRAVEARHDEDKVVAGYASFVFLLDGSGDVHAVPHALYVALARGQASAPALAGQTLRLADWYVRLKGGKPDVVVNETYGLARFNEQGEVDWARSSSTHPRRPGDIPVPEDATWPTATERERMQAILFDGSASATNASVLFGPHEPDSASGRP